MATYEIVLTEADDMSLSYVAASPQEWIDNAVQERCRLAGDEIVQLTVKKCLENGTQIPNTREAIIALAFEQEWVKTAAQQAADTIASYNSQ